MLEFLKLNWENALLIVIFAGALIAAIKIGYKKQVKQMLLALVVKAEKEYGGGTGQLKFAAVCNWIYEKLPSLARFFVTAKDIENLIEDAVDYMKKYLSDNDKANAIVGG